MKRATIIMKIEKTKHLTKLLQRAGKKDNGKTKEKKK